jgi:DNA-directed RNA polymerase subunit beta
MILQLFYDIEELTIKQADALEDIQNKVLIEDAMDLDKGIVVARAFEPLSKVVVKQIAELGVSRIKVVDTTKDDGIVIKCLKKDPPKNEDEALKDIYRRLRPGDPPTAANARALIKRLFFDPNATTWVGWGVTRSTRSWDWDKQDSRILTKEDLVAATRYLLRLEDGARAAWTTSITWAAGGCEPWVNCWPTNAASAWRGPSAWSRNA